jgi:hypothetical protein
MKLNKEFAEDLVYIQDNPNGVNFSTKKSYPLLQAVFQKRVLWDTSLDQKET